MTDNTHDWRAQPPKGLWATITASRCGWHVYLHQREPGAAGALKAIVIGKSCIPYRVDPNTESGYSQLMALAIGIINITDEVPEECSNL